MCKWNANVINQKDVNYDQQSGCRERKQKSWIFQIVWGDEPKTEFYEQIKKQ